MPPKRPGHLPRLNRAHYQGYAIVLWTHCIEERKTGWLSEKFHLRFRETLLHALIRSQLCCSAYVLMPDHMHLLIMGLQEQSDQLVFNRFLRKRLNLILHPRFLQKQGHDHVLREQERDKEAFQKTTHYILENPARAKLSPNWQGYQYSGCLFPGYCDFDPRNDKHWETFWRVYNKKVEE